jgi:hypothetical protein
MAENGGTVTWQGHVTGVGTDTFHAEILEDGATAWESAEIPMHHLAPGDRADLAEGALLTMTAGRAGFSVRLVRGDAPIPDVSVRVGEIASAIAARRGKG